jgi:hypothetical protein
MVTVTLRNGTVYKLPESALEYQGNKSIGYAPVADFMNEFPVRGATGVEYVPFSAIKRIQLTPELIDFDALEEDTFPSPGTLTYRDGTEMSVDFAFGSAYGGFLSFFCPYHYSIPLRNNGFYYIGGTYMNENTISEILSIEFDA